MDGRAVDPEEQMLPDDVIDAVEELAQFDPDALAADFELFGDDELAAALRAADASDEQSV